MNANDKKAIREMIKNELRTAARVRKIATGEGKKMAEAYYQGVRDVAREIYRETGPATRRTATRRKRRK